MCQALCVTCGYADGDEVALLSRSPQYSGEWRSVEHKGQQEGWILIKIKYNGIQRLEPTNETWELAEFLPVYSMILGKSPDFCGLSFSFCERVKIISYKETFKSRVESK